MTYMKQEMTKKQKGTIILCRGIYTLPLVLIFFNLLPLLTCANDEEKKYCKLLLKSSSGILIFPSNNACQKYLYNIEAEMNTSVIKVTSESYLEENNTSTFYSDGALSSDHEDVDRSIVIIFQENTVLKNGTNVKIPLEKWDLTVRNVKKERLYLSRTSHLDIQVTVIGDWTSHGVKLSYEELPFKVYKKSSNKERGEIFPSNFSEGMKDRGYSPHSASIFQIQKSPNMNVSSILVDLNYLDIDVGIGEYLLIGAGDNPWDGAPPFFIANARSKKKTYMVNDENAYIVFVAGSTRKHHQGYKLMWRHNGTKIKIEEEISTGKDEAEIQAIQVCIYNYSAAEAEFQKPIDERFIEFRKELSHFARKEMPNINASQISFYRISAIIKGDKSHEEGYYYVMLKIEGSQKGKAAFKRSLLQKIFSNYNSSTEFNNYRIGKCPTRKAGNFGFYAIIPIFCCVFIFIWTWKQNPLSEYFTGKKLRKTVIKEGQPQDATSADDNIYSVCPPIFALPKLHLTDELGRRFTLNYNDTMAAYADDGGHKIEVESTWTRRRTSRIQGFLNIRHSNSNRSSVRKAEINEGYVDEDNGATRAFFEKEITNGNQETENVYDSVKSMEIPMQTIDNSATRL